MQSYVTFGKSSSESALTIIRKLQLLRAGTDVNVLPNSVSNV